MAQQNPAWGSTNVLGANEPTPGCARTIFHRVGKTFWHPAQKISFKKQTIQKVFVVLPVCTAE